MILKETNKKKILILGGGPNQYLFVKAAKQNNLFVVLCDYDTSNMSIEYADKFYEASILDKELVMEIAKKENVDGIFTTSEPGMYTAIYIAEKLDLPSMPYKSFLTLVNKPKMKKFLKENNFNYPRYKTVNSDYQIEEIVSELTEWDTKYIVKPIDSSGSRGVTVIETPTEIEQAIEEALSFSKSKKAIIEEYIEQKYDFMIGGDIFVLNGEVVFWGIMDSMRDLEVNDTVPTGTRYPSIINSSELMEVKKVVNRVIELLDIDFATFNLEIMYDINDRIYINEMNPRSGGNFIPEILYRATGFSFYKYAPLGACGLIENNQFDIREKYVSTYVVHSRESGVLKGISIDNHIKDNIVEKAIDKHPGEKVEKFISAPKRIGILFMEFSNKEEMYEKLDNINKYVEIILEEQ